VPRSDLGRYETKALHGVLNTLKRSRADLIDLLTKGVDPSGKTPSDFDSFFAAERADAINREMDAVTDELLRRVDNELAGIAQVGVEDFNRSARSASTRMPTVGVDANTVALVQEIAGAKIAQVTAVMKADVRIAISRAVSGGLTIPQLQAEIKTIMGGERTAAQIERIIRNEIGTAYSQAQAAANDELIDAGAEEDLIKVWRTTGDGRSRPEHRDIHGQERELSDLFNMGNHKAGIVITFEDGPSRKGHRINGPQDPTLPIHLAIQCRCTVSWVPRSKARQSYITKDPKKARKKEALTP